MGQEGLGVKKKSAPGPIRTGDPRIRRQEDSRNIAAFSQPCDPGGKSKYLLDFGANENDNENGLATSQRCGHRIVEEIANFEVRNKMKKVISGAVLVGLLLLISACGGSTTPSNPTVEQITVISTKPGTTPEFQIGETDQFKATAVYSDSSVKDITASATWSSTDTSKATVNSTGLVTAVAAGTVSILAAYSGRSATLMISVVPNP